MGDDRWVTGDSFPVAADRPLVLYLSSSAGANSLFGDGPLAERSDDCCHLGDGIGPVSRRILFCLFSLPQRSLRIRNSTPRRR
jgi:hypothetical protein